MVWISTTWYVAFESINDTKGKFPQQQQQGFGQSTGFGQQNTGFGQSTGFGQTTSSFDTGFSFGGGFGSNTGSGFSFGQTSSSGFGDSGFGFGNTTQTSSGFGFGQTSSGFSFGETKSSSGFGFGDSSSTGFNFGFGNTSSGFGNTSSGFGTGSGFSFGNTTQSSGFTFGDTGSGFGSSNTGFSFGSSTSSGGFSFDTKPSTSFSFGSDSSGFSFGGGGFGDTKSSSGGFSFGSTGEGFSFGNTSFSFGSTSNTFSFGADTSSNFFSSTPAVQPPKINTSPYGTHELFTQAIEQITKQKESVAQETSVVPSFKTPPRPPVRVRPRALRSAGKTPPLKDKLALFKESEEETSLTPESFAPTTGVKSLTIEREIEEPQIDIEKDKLHIEATPTKDDSFNDRIILSTPEKKSPERVPERVLTPPRPQGPQEGVPLKPTPIKAQGFVKQSLFYENQRKEDEHKYVKLHILFF